MARVVRPPWNWKRGDGLTASELEFRPGGLNLLLRDRVLIFSGQSQPRKLNSTRLPAWWACLQVLCETCTTDQHIWLLAAWNILVPRPRAGQAALSLNTREEIHLRRIRNITKWGPAGHGLCLPDYLLGAEPPDTSCDLSTNTCDLATLIVFWWHSALVRPAPDPRSHRIHSIVRAIATAGGKYCIHPCIPEEGGLFRRTIGRLWWDQEHSDDLLSWLPTMPSRVANILPRCTPSECLL